MVGAATGPGGRPRRIRRPTPRRLGLGAIAVLAGGVASCSYNDVGLPPAQEPAGPADGSAGVRDAASGSDRVSGPDAAPDPPGGCKPAPERCDGADEDCDGVVDDGCPVDRAPVFTDGPRVSSPTFGSATLDQNIAVTHRCPSGQAAIAFTGNFGYAVDSLGVICGILRVREDRTSMPFRYFVEVEPGQRFEPVGGMSGGLNDVTRCPPGFVIGAVAGWPSRPTGTCPTAYCASGRAPSCPSNFGLEIVCTRFDIAGSPGDFRLAPSQAPPFRAAARVEIDLAGIGFPSAKADYLCPRGQVVVDAYGSVGPWPYDCSKTAVNGLRVSCTEPTVRLR